MNRIGLKQFSLGTAWIGALIASSFGNHLRAQVATLVAIDSAKTNDINQPFLLSSAPSDVVESIDDYRRYCQRGQWEKAFKQLDKLSAVKTGLVPDKGGVRVPPSLVFVHLVAELPADGKKAFQLFNDADAKSLLDEALGKVEEEKLNVVATRYLFTSSGDTAADRFGDLLFERGEFAQAMQAWRRILTYRPDSEIPQAQLLVKIATAAARDGRWPEFQDIDRQLRDRYSDAEVKLGGQRANAIEFVTRLAAAQPKSDADPNASRVGAAKVHLPSDAKPLWQFRWFAQANPVLGNREGLVVYDQMYGRQYGSDFVPPVVADEAHVYSEMVGYGVGIDLETGKLAWRSGRFFDLMKTENQNNGQRNMLLERSGILSAHGKVWSVAREISNQSQNGNDSRYNLIARDPATGKELYNSKTAKDGARDFIMFGMPTADEGHIYVGGYKPNQATDVYALCLSAADGKLVWNTKIGSYKNDPRQQFYYSSMRTTVPSLLVAGGALYVETHAGSLVQVNKASGEINWGMNYESDSPSTDRNYNQPPEQCSMCRPQLVDGVLYFKGMRSRRLYAIDPAEPKVLWSRPVPITSVLCGVDKERIYLGGPEITAYDLKTQRLLWSQQVPLGTGWTTPLMSADRIYQFSPRGIYELDKLTGGVMQLLRGADMESLGGSLILTPGALLTVSNVAITAYPIEPVKDEKAE